MSVPQFIDRARRRQNDVMTDTCTVTRSGGEATVDPDTFELTWPDDSLVYSGRCLVRHLSHAEPAVANVPADTALYKVKLPAGTAIADGDLVTVTASTFDDDLVGSGLVVQAVRHDGWQISREAICERQFTGPLSSS